MPRPTFLSRWFSPRQTSSGISTAAHPTPNASSHLAPPTPPAFSHTAPLSHAAPHKSVAPSQAARQFPHAVSHFPRHALSRTIPHHTGYRSHSPPGTPPERPPSTASPNGPRHRPARHGGNPACAKSPRAGGCVPALPATQRRAG